jgi:hypothetical protein
MEQQEVAWRSGFVKELSSFMEEANDCCFLSKNDFILPYILPFGIEAW